MDTQYHSKDDWHTTTQNLADEPTFANETPVPEQRWLPYYYTILGRWTYLGQWNPSTRAEMTCIPLHKTGQVNLFCLNTMVKVWKLALTFSISEIPHSIFSKHIFCWEISFLFFLKLQKSLLVSWVIKNKCLEYCYSKLGRWTFFSQWTPSTTAKMTGIPLSQNLADEPTLANETPVPEQIWLAYHYTKLGRWTYFAWIQW